MIVITGASTGVGLALAKLYKETGTKLVNVSRQPSEAADVNILCDMSKAAEQDRAIAEINKLPEKLLAIVNCVGVYSEEQFGDMSDDEIEKLFATNAKAPMLFISKLLDRITQDEADVLTIVSKAGTQASKDNPVYVASKWAERGFVLSLQDKLKSTRCRVISFCPGGIQTDLFKKANADIDTTGWMRPEDVAAFMKQILELPKSMEVSEVVINRKTG